MRSTRKVIMTIGLVALAGVIAGTAMATPAVDSAVVKPRIWNDDPTSNFSSGNLFPGSIWMLDENLDGDGQGSDWANRHNFRLSENGGVSEAVFMNEDSFIFSADVTITGTADIEGGLNVSPWWSKDVDGVFMLKTSTGEVACWGGRLPYYSFTANHGINYVKGQTVRLTVAYQANGLTDLDPATIEYTYNDGVMEYSSGLLPFDQGNPAENPPYGLWGMLNDARVGGFFMPLVNTADPNNWGRIDYANMRFVPEPASLVLLALAGLVTFRRR